MHDGGSETEEEELDNAVLPAILFKFGLTLSSTVFSTMNVEHGQMRDDKKTAILLHASSIGGSSTAVRHVKRSTGPSTSWSV